MAASQSGAEPRPAPYRPRKRSALASDAPAAGQTTTKISRAAVAHIVAPNSGHAQSDGDQPLVTRSGNEVTTMHDLVISQLGGNDGLVSLPGLKKNSSGRLS